MDRKQFYFLAGRAGTGKGEYMHSGVKGENSLVEVEPGREKGEKTHTNHEILIITVKVARWTRTLQAVRGIKIRN